MIPVSSWGRLDAALHEVITLTDPGQLDCLQPQPNIKTLAHGMGRSYGDACLNADGHLWHTTGLDHFQQWDPVTGRLRCEAGVLLRDIQRLALPHGWMLAVSPGTQLVTVGGAIANDVHGKNHHVMGSFGDHVLRLSLRRSDGERIECGPTLRRDWFRATVGGVGLTGLILDADIQLRRVPGPWLDAETLAFSDLSEFFGLADGSEAGWEHTVAWIDCLSRRGRGLFMRANSVAASDGPRPGSRTLAMPLVPPVSLVNRLTLKPFNATYYHGKRWKAGRQQVHYEPFFYPLDGLLHWNRMYGPRGFFQYQCVVPRADGMATTQAMLAAIASADQGSFLAVLKTFGNREPLGLLSFAQPGVTLALDFPNNGTRTLRLFERLDAIVREAGGRIYLAKDARMPRALFEAGYPGLQEFLRYRDPGISSGLSRRLMGN